MFLAITLIVAALSAFHLYLTWNYNYWRKRNVPGPKPAAGFGNLQSLWVTKRPVAVEVEEIYGEYSSQYNFVGVFRNRTPRIMTTSAEAAKDVLSRCFKSFHENEFGAMTNRDVDPLFSRNPFSLTGDEWKAKRAEIIAAFSTTRMKALFSLVGDVCSRMTAYLEQKRGTPLDSRELSAKFTTDAVSNCIFACDALSFASESPAVREQGRILEQAFSSFRLMWFKMNFPLVTNLFRISFIPRSLEKFFADMMHQAIRDRDSKTNGYKADFLEHLISLKEKKGISEVDMAAHILTFIIDGFETPSVVLSFLFYELARNPDIQKRLREELVGATNSEGTISCDALLELPYLDQVVNEGLRMWPPAPVIAKKCTEPIELALTKDRNVTIEKGVSAIVNIWSLHRDPRYYPDPLTFNPERFSAETGGTGPYREIGCFLPFSDGPRQCPGMRFGRMEVKRCLYEVLKKFQITVNPKTVEPIQLDTKQSLTSALGGMWLNFDPVSK